MSRGDYHLVTDIRLGDKNGKIIAQDVDFIVFYLPGRTVYVDSEQGSQYAPSEYVLLKKEKEGKDQRGQPEFWSKEIFRFSRSV